MKVGIVGAGMTGLTAAYRLAMAGHQPVVFERWPGLGGQAATVELDGVTLERYYHHLFTSDREIAGLFDELGIGSELEWHESSVAVFRDGRIWPFSGPLDLLRFGPLSPIARVRLGLGVIALQRLATDPARFEGMTARELVDRWLGRRAWPGLWGPLLEAKFGSRAGALGASWLWSKLTLRRAIKGRDIGAERLGYPRGGWDHLLARLVEEIETGGGRVEIDRPVAAIERGEGFQLSLGSPGSFRRGHDPEEFDRDGTETCDTVLVTVPGDGFSRLLGPDLREEVGAGYLGSVGAIEHQAALCLLVETDRQFSPHYWTNIAEPGMPFIGLIEQTNMIDPGAYGGRRFLYIANYCEDGDPLLELGAEQLLDAYEDGLRRVNPDYRRDWFGKAWRFVEPQAQPVVLPGQAARIPALRTPADGLFLATTAQVYPEDRGTNYAVRLGNLVAEEMMAA